MAERFTAQDQEMGEIMRSIRLAAAAACLTLSGASHGAILYAQTPTTDLSATCSATSGCPNIYATQFTLGTAGTATAIKWRGYGPNYGGVTDKFSVDFYNDAAGTVGSLLGSFYIGSSYTAVDTGLDVSGIDIYEFTATLGSGVALASGASWLTIYNSHTWAWQDADTPPYYAINGSADGGTSWSAAYSPKNYYFVLEQTVPVPAALWLFVSAMGSLAWLRRRMVMA